MSAPKRGVITMKAADKRKLIDEIIAKVRAESPFVESSEYTIETVRRVLEEVLSDRA